MNIKSTYITNTYNVISKRHQDWKTIRCFPPAKLVTTLLIFSSLNLARTMAMHEAHTKLRGDRKSSLSVAMPSPVSYTKKTAQPQR